MTTTVVELDQTPAKREIASAWKHYKQTEKYGLEFGEVCYEWQQKLAEKGQRVKGRGVVPILEQLDIPVSTAYWWIDRYKESVGLKTAKHETRKHEAPPKPSASTETAANAGATPIRRIKPADAVESLSTHVNNIVTELSPADTAIVLRSLIAHLQDKLSEVETKVAA